MASSDSHLLVFKPLYNAFLLSSLLQVNRMLIGCTSMRRLQKIYFHLPSIFLKKLLSQLAYFDEGSGHVGGTHVSRNRG